jgi:hypothetical protein
MHIKSTMCNKTLSKWCKNKHGASKIIDTFETYQCPKAGIFPQRGTFTIQAALPALSEACIQHVHDSGKIMTLLFDSSDCSSQQGTFVKYSKQP